MDIKDNFVTAIEEYGLHLFDKDTVELIEDEVVDKTIPELIASIPVNIDPDIVNLVSDIPMASVFSSVVKTAQTVRDFCLIRKFLVFQKKFEAGYAPENEINRRREAVQQKKKWIQREIELLLIRIDNISEKRNVEILCNVYLEYLNGECSKDQFEEAAVLLERFVSYDEKQLKAFYEVYLIEHGNESNKTFSIKTDNVHCDRLVALGLLWTQYYPVAGGMNISHGITDIGIILAKAMK